MHVLVVTVVHDPNDARIRFRQIAALQQHGHEVTFAAPFRAYGRTPPPGVAGVDLPRSQGRRRVRAILAARRAIRAVSHDVVVVHDPELLLALAGQHRSARVWDVHEDTAAALTNKAWLPTPVRTAVRSLVRLAERWAERHLTLLLAEDAYAERFRHPHTVVSNDVLVPASVGPTGADRVLYVGRLTRARGALLMIEVARLLPPGIHLELIGPADADVQPALEHARDAGWLDWLGPLANDEALARVEGALAGLSLLRDEPNYRHSRPTKVVEYMAGGVPVITTPLPIAEHIVRTADCGVVVPFDNASAVAAAIRELAADPRRRQRLADNGRTVAKRDYDWSRSAAAFVAALESARR